MKSSAYAKVNLLLKVTGKRKDGYHQLQMIMQTISLADHMNFKKTDKKQIRVRMINSPEKIKQEDNIVYKVAVYLKNRYKLPGGLEITIKKNIPTGAGLGGGSSDAAETIKAINKIYSLALTTRQMQTIGRKFGSDVCFFIKGGLAVVSGVGDKIYPLAPIKKFYGILLKPSYQLSTARVYQKVSNISRSKKLPGQFHNLSEVIPVMENDLTIAAAAIRPSIAKTIDKLQGLTEAKVLMTGSGSAIAIYFSDKKQRDIFDQKKPEFGGGKYYLFESVCPDQEKKKELLKKSFALGTAFTFVAGIIYRNRSVKSGTYSRRGNTT